MWQRLLKVLWMFSFLFFLFISFFERITMIAWCFFFFIWINVWLYVICRYQYIYIIYSMLLYLRYCYFLSDLRWTQKKKIIIIFEWIPLLFVLSFFQLLTHIFKTLHTNPRIAQNAKCFTSLVKWSTAFKISQTHLKSKHLQILLP